MTPFTELKVLDKKTFQSAASELCGATKAQLTEMLAELQKYVPGPYVITMGGKEVPDPDTYICPRKSYTWKLAEVARYVALFFHNPANLKLYWDRVDGMYLSLVRILAQEGYVAAVKLQALGFSDIIKVTRSRYYYENRCSVVEHAVWFEAVTSQAPGRDWWETVSYLHLNPRVAPVAVRSLGLLRNPYLETLPDGLAVRSAEAEAIGSVPLIEAVIKQGTLKFSTAKVTAASSLKFMKSLPIPDVMPDFTEQGDKFNLGQVFLPLFNLLPFSKMGKTPPEVLKKATELLFSLYVELLLPMLLPHIKGLKPVYTRVCCPYFLMALKQYFNDGRSDWLDLDAVTMWLALCANLTIDSRGISSMRLEDTFTGDAVTLDRTAHLERELLASLCMSMYALGMVELAMEVKDDYTALFDHVKAVRLTALGRYAFGLEKTYKAPEIKNETLFELDESRLIIRSLKPGNPYESLLRDTSVPIGNNRFLMSPESFLKNCKTTTDVKEKTDFFYQYVCADPPAVWQDFFKTIKHRCHPLNAEKAGYDIYTIDPSDTTLIDILTSDPFFKDLVIRAEGYRILVPISRKTSFVNHLKTYGYLL